MRRVILSLVILAFVASFAFAAGKIRIGLLISTLNNPFFVSLRDGAVDAAKYLGVDLIVYDAQDDVAKQINQMEDLIEQKVDVILVNPCDSDAIVPAVEEANKAGIPVVTVDRGSNGGFVVAHIASDNVEGGRMAARFIIEALKGHGNVVELEGIPGTSAARDRGKGFHEVIDKYYPAIKVIARQTAYFNRAKGLEVMENIIQAWGDKIDAVFCHNDEMALGAIEALREAGLLGKVIVVGFDAIPEAVEAVKRGEMAATIAQQPYLMGKKAVEVGYQIATMRYIPMPLKLVTKETTE